MKHVIHRVLHAATLGGLTAATVGAVIDENLLKQLLDEQQSQTARSALQAMSDPAAGQALRDALTRTAGSTRAGILDSLGLRGEPDAVASIAPYVGDADPVVADAAITALGKIGGLEAIAALQAVQGTLPVALQASLCNSLLACADKLRMAGDARGAKILFAGLFMGSTNDAVRAGAYRGLILSDPEQTFKRLVNGLGYKDDRGSLEASVKLAGELPGDDVTKVLTRTLGSQPAGIQIALLAALVQRNAAEAVQSIAPLVQSPNSGVRRAARDALSKLGDDKAIPVIVGGAEGATSEEKKDMRQALALLRGRGISRALVDQIPKATPEQQEVLLGAIGDRLDPSVGPTLVKLARTGDAKLRILLFKSIKMVGSDELATDLIACLKTPQPDDERNNLEQALSSIATRSAHREALAKPVLVALSGADSATKISLYNICAQLTGPSVRQALMTGIKDADERVQDAAAGALGALDDVAAWEDMATLARSGARLPHRVIAFRGCLRLADTKKISDEERLEILRTVAPLASRPEEMVLFCGSASRAMNYQCLPLLEPFLRDATVRGAAVAAYWTIARDPASHQEPHAVLAALHTLLPVAEGATKAEVEKLMAELRARLSRK